MKRQRQKRSWNERAGTELTGTACKQICVFEIQFAFLNSSTYIEGKRSEG
jgi:hypothetical protein